MGAISNFVAAFERDFDKYSDIEKRVEALCKKKTTEYSSIPMAISGEKFGVAGEEIERSQQRV